MSPLRRRLRTGGGVPWWGLASASAAPVLLIGGWTLAAARQSSGFDPVRETISALAATDADDRWIMTVALTGLGLCHLTTAAALQEAAPVGRAVLAAGGAATVLVAAFPLQGPDESSVVHAVAAGIAFVSLGGWPLLASKARSSGLLRRRASRTAGLGLLALVGWFGVELLSDGDRVGLAERVAAGAQALWPLAVVVSTRRRAAAQQS